MSEVNSILTEPWNGKAGTTIESGLKTEILARALVSAIPTALSQLTNDVGFIVNTVDNLIFYYTKTQTYTKSEVDALIGSVQSIRFEVVAMLPETGQTNVIYLVAKQPSGYDQYIWAEVEGVYQFVHIGTTDIDLSAYATRTWVNEQVANFLTEAQIRVIVESYGYTTMLAVEAKGYQTAQQVSDAITVATADMATRSWIASQGYQTAIQVSSAITTALIPYYTASQTDAAIALATDDMATKTWVGNQNYQNGQQVADAITSATTDMATKTWVGSQGYKNESQVKTLVNGVFSFDSQTGELDITLYE